MPITFPRELADEIIDLLAGDSNSLKACSMIGRVWIPRSRLHLFESWKCVLLPKNIRGFHEILQSPYGCSFLPLIRSVKATRYCWHHNDRYFDDIAADLRVVPVHTLELKLNGVVNAGNVNRFFCEGFAAAFPHITRLVLTCSFDGQPAPLIDMICLSPALQELHICLETSGFEPQTAKPLASAVPPRGLRILRLSGVYTAEPILEWLYEFNHLPNVESLTLPWRIRTKPIVNAAFQQLGESLYHLSLPHCDWDNVDLSPLRNIRTLIIRGGSGEKLLSKLTAPALEYLSVDALDRERAAVRSHLTPARFPSLRKVNF
ncbi:hypothetical protein DFH08DRAFT_215242 [Mycena albidolilacea]|uniref:F-box domain-containing protein n=1 Tax=Mycena albidolilacea TaxID=1033008 RepID=A0AAD7EPZ8_9AGAR|nr:hypothetical protein DFH08DRAFT_215242 [Mycena albidolilacea]